MQSGVDWEHVAADPDLRGDLGYEWSDLDVVRPENGSDQVVLLPKDEEMLHNDAFLVADEESLVDVGSRR